MSIDPVVSFFLSFAACLTATTWWVVVLVLAAKRLPLVDGLTLGVAVGAIFLTVWWVRLAKWERISE